LLISSFHHLHLAMARGLALVVVLALADVQQVRGSLKTPSTRRLSSKEFFMSQDLHEAITDSLMVFGGSSQLGGRSAVHAHVSEGFQNATHEAPDSSPELTWQQKVELLGLVRSLSNFSLRFNGPQRRLSETNTSEPSLFTYRSTDTGDLGSDGTRSVSEVVLHRTPAGADFHVGPAVGSMYLIRGRMDVTRRDQDQISGNIKAGFVNLRSTLSGTWQADGPDFNSTLHIHLRDMGLAEDWAWSPQP
jgi:hypothetical protein